MTHSNPLLVHSLPLPRRRDDNMQTHRSSFVATPTAELSNQEETLLGDILDWSLDTSCSGYEGDQEESEGEKDGDCEYEEQNGNGLGTLIQLLAVSKVLFFSKEHTFQSIQSVFQLDIM